MRITSKGQVTIPVEIRHLAGLLPETEVEITYDGHDVKIIKSDSPPGRSRGERAVSRLWGSGGHSSMSTSEIMALMRDGGDDVKAAS